MVKLSDALRGAADRAPLDGISVNGHRAARRAATQRGLRTGAGGVLGAGMVAVLAFGVIGPRGLSAAEDSGRNADATMDGGAGAEALAPDVAAGSWLPWGLCGYELPALEPAAGPVALTATLPKAETDGDSLVASVTTTVVADGAFETFGIDGVVLWDGIVVGTLDGAPGDGVAREATVVNLTAGDQTTTEISVPLVNCWDGEPLPASKYELVVSQELFGITVVDEPPLPEPVETLAPEEPAEPTPATDPDEPTVDPAAEGVANPDGTVESTGDGSTASDGVEDVVSTSISSGGPSSRIVASAVGFVITGDPVENPFAAYLEPAPEPEPRPTLEQPPLPEGTLDPDTARALYLDGLAGAWDMAPGTQRWTASNDWTGALEGGYYGCAYDGAGAFPSRSAVVDMLDVTVDAPSRIDVSYGWIVEGNPEVRTRLTNTSEWDLAGFWGMDSLQLVLVRDGRVVAEAYPVNPLQNQIAYAEDMAAASGSAEGDAAMAIYPAPGGELASGESSDGLYVWRDINGCWTESGQGSVEPGTYTLLAMNYLSVGGGAVIMEGYAEDLPRGTFDESMTSVDGADQGFGSGTSGSEGLGGSSTDAGSALDGSTGTGTAIAPAPDMYGMYDAVDFQVWTSLGQIRVG